METTEKEEQEENEERYREWNATLELDSKWFDEMVAAARVVYFWHNGKQHLEIERKMRELGWTAFNRGYLYSAKRAHGRRRQSWPERYGWIDQVTRARPKKRRKKAAIKIPGSFPKWLSTVFPEWKWKWPYQKYLYERLARVTSGECKRLMIFMPPRHGKSEMVTFRYTAWRLLRDPALNVIVGSYNQRLANKASRRIQRIHQDPNSRTTRPAASPSSLSSSAAKRIRGEPPLLPNGKLAEAVR